MSEQKVYAEWRQRNASLLSGTSTVVGMPKAAGEVDQVKSAQDMWDHAIEASLDVTNPADLGSLFVNRLVCRAIALEKAASDALNPPAKINRLSADLADLLDDTVANGKKWMCGLQFVTQPTHANVKVLRPFQNCWSDDRSFDLAA